MRNPVFFLVFGVIVLLFGLLNYYIGLRGWQSLGTFYKIPRKIYWVLFWFLAMSYIGARIAESFLPEAVSRILVAVGANWLVFMFYFIIVIALVDILRIAGNLTGILPGLMKQYPLLPVIAGIAVSVLVTGIWAYGTWNARHPRVTNYEVKLDKAAGTVQDLHMVMISDIHLGSLVGVPRLTAMIDKVNALKPDIVVFAGDVIDEDVNYFIEHKMDDYFRQIKAKYGVYAVLGNHEYIGGYADEAVRQLTQGGVTVLRDDYVKVADSFYIVGRDDKSGARFNGQQRKDIPELLADLNKDLPVILLDHQPVDLTAAEENGVDIQLSGHTHRGQMFPNQLITRRIYENDYGYLLKGNLHSIVSSGFGTWGPPVRIGNISEIVDLNIRFK